MQGNASRCLRDAWHGSWMGRPFLCGKQLRGSESGKLERFTVSLTSISLFLGVVVFGVVVCVWCVGSSVVLYFWFCSSRC